MSILNITDPYSRVRYFLSLVQFQNPAMVHLCFPSNDGKDGVILTAKDTLELNRVMEKFVLSVGKDRNKGYVLQPEVKYLLAVSHTVGRARLVISVDNEGVLRIDDDSAMKIFGQALTLLPGVVSACNDRDSVNMVEIEFQRAATTGAYKLAVNAGHLKVGPLPHQLSVNIAGIEHYFWTKTLDKITAINERGLPVHLFRQAWISIPDVDLEADWFNDELRSEELDRSGWLQSVAMEINNNFAMAQGFHVINHELLIPGLDKNPKNYVAIVTEDNDLVIKVKQGEHAMLIPSGADTLIMYDMRTPTRNIMISDRINGVFTIINNTL